MTSIMHVDSLNNAAGTGPTDFPNGLTKSGGVKIISSANYTITTTDGAEQILVSTGASNRTITLPTVGSSAGRRLTIIKTDSGAGTVIITPSGAETINGASSRMIYLQYIAINMVCDGSNWFTEDSYIEGSWTPVITGSGGGAATYGTQFGSYTKIGRMVYAQCNVIFGSGTLSGNISITGLPVTSANTASSFMGGCISYWSGLVTSIVATSAYVAPNSTSGVIARTTAASTNTNTLFTASDFAAGSTANELIVTFIYPAQD